MKDLYYNIEDAEFISQSGEKLSRFLPELFYQENAVWRIFLRDRENRPCDISGIIAWSAAVDRNYDSETAPMCRVLPENISADTTAGSVTVTLDAATAEFLAAVNGVAKRKAFFEMHGINATGDRKLYLGFEISARMILDPAPGVPQQVPEIFATRFYTDLTVASAAAAVSTTLQQQLNERPATSETRQIAAEAAANAASGAIFSGAEIHTTVGDYLLTYTASGGLVVSGSGASMVLSGGQIAVEAGDEDQECHFDITGSHIFLSAPDEAYMLVSNGGISLQTRRPPEDLEFDPPQPPLYVNSRPVATQLETLTDTETTSAYIEVLNGGRNYVYTLPLYSLEVVSVTKTTEASYLHFTLDSVTAPTPVVISGVSCLNSATFEGGKEYLVGFFDGMAVVNEVTSGGLS